MVEAPPLVCVVDDDASVRESIDALLRSMGMVVRLFSSSDAFLVKDGDEREVGCLVLDVSMPGMSGPELQEELARRGATTPIVFISAHSNAVLQRQVLERGAIAYLVKPFDEDALIEAIQLGIRRNVGRD